MLMITSQVKIRQMTIRLEKSSVDTLACWFCLILNLSWRGKQRQTLNTSSKTLSDVMDNELFECFIADLFVSHPKSYESIIDRDTLFISKEMKDFDKPLSIQSTVMCLQHTCQFKVQ